MVDAAEQAAPAAEGPVRRLTGIPVTLWTHVAWELMRVFLVTTGIIVSVIAFGAAAKPLADSSIGADTVFKYVSLAMVPMLQFAIPFSAGFASTLVIHRFATDNELLAMSACGMSHRRIMAPVVLLGGFLCVVTLVLVSLVIPRFWTRMKELATADATQMLVGAVARGEALAADRMMIYADAAREVDPPPGSGARRRLLLTGVAAVELESPWSSSIVTEFTAEDAAVDIHVTPRGTVAKMALMNATVIRPGEGAIVTVPVAEPEAASVYSGFERSPKFLTVPEILDLRKDVDLAMSVLEAKKPLAAMLGELDLWRCVEPVAASGSIELAQDGSGRSVRIEGARLAAGTLVPLEGRARFALAELVDGRTVRRAEAPAGTLRAISESGFAPRFSLAVPGAVEAVDTVSGLPGRWSPRIDDLLPRGCEPRDWAAAPSAEVMAAAGSMPDADGAGPYAALRAAAAGRAATLDIRRKDAVWESDSHLANRAAQSVSVVLVLLLGAVLAAAMRHAMPLTVYVMAFVPAIANIFMLSSGQLMMSDGRTVLGSAVMWGGNAVVLGAVVLAWRRLARN
jgi:lipopolysaccharide export system permease protein